MTNENTTPNEMTVPCTDEESCLCMECRIDRAVEYDREVACGCWDEENAIDPREAFSDRAIATLDGEWRRFRHSSAERQRQNFHAELDAARAMFRACPATDPEFFDLGDIVTALENQLSELVPKEYNPNALDLAGVGSEREDLRTSLSDAWNKHRYLQIRVDEMQAAVMRTSPDGDTIAQALSNPQYGLSDEQKSQWLSRPEVESLQDRLGELNFTKRETAEGDAQITDPNYQWAAPPLGRPDMDGMRSWVFSLLSKDDVHSPVECYADIDTLDRYHNHDGLRIAVVGPVFPGPYVQDKETKEWSIDIWKDTVEVDTFDDGTGDNFQVKRFTRSELVTWKHDAEMFSYGLAPNDTPNAGIPGTVHVPLTEEGRAKAKINNAALSATVAQRGRQAYSARLHNLAPSVIISRR